MMLDHLFRNVNLPDGTEGVDVGIREGKIVVVEKVLDAEALQTTDGKNCMLSAHFVDSHFHMDATLSLGQPRLNQSGTLLEGIQLWGELKPELTQEAIRDRALRYCDLAVSQGLLAVRSHVDVCDSRLLAVEALLEVKNQVKPYLCDTMKDIKKELGIKKKIRTYRRCARKLFLNVQKKRLI